MFLAVMKYRVKTHQDVFTVIFPVKNFTVCKYCTIYVEKEVKRGYGIIRLICRTLSGWEKISRVITSKIVSQNKSFSGVVDLQATLRLLTDPCPVLRFCVLYSNISTSHCTQTSGIIRKIHGCVFLCHHCGERLLRTAELRYGHTLNLWKFSISLSLCLNDRNLVV